MVTIERRNCTRRYLRRMKTISAINLLAIVIVAAFRVSTVKGVKNPRHQVSTTKKSRLENKPESLSKQFYNLGISVHNDDKKPRPFQKLTLRCHQAFHKLWENRMRLFHLFIFVRYSHCTVESILEDSWEAERNPDKYFGKKGILSSKERSVVKRRVVSSSTIRKIVGAGYTPRLVFLFGVMLRGIIHCTAIPKIFEVRGQFVFERDCVSRQVISRYCVSATANDWLGSWKCLCC
jgi:hypothetical protein